MCFSIYMLGTVIDLYQILHLFSIGISVLGSFHTMRCFKSKLHVKLGDSCLSHTVSTYESLDRKSTFHPINQEINKDVQSWCDSISEGGTIMHRQTGLSRVFFIFFCLFHFWALKAQTVCTMMVPQPEQ